LTHMNLATIMNGRELADRHSLWMHRDAALEVRDPCREPDPCAISSR
jgi:hypothetical protein